LQEGKLKLLLAGRFRPKVIPTEKSLRKEGFHLV